jgi:bifunctional UDP-N-acetylglucosamine pyrophosphorylase/glucosamine-1-phosphate N-acetyltransferase
MNIVILAAGLGKRMRSRLPKVLHCVAGRPMLEHVIGTAQQVAAGRGGPTRTVVVIGHGAEQVRSLTAATSILFCSSRSSVPAMR